MKNELDWTAPECPGCRLTDAGKKRVTDLFAEMGGWRDRAEAAEAEAHRLREKNRELNRRCSTYEAGLEEKIKTVSVGTSFGRMLANSAASMYRKRVADLERAIAEIGTHARVGRTLHDLGQTTTALAGIAELVDAATHQSGRGTMTRDEPLPPEETTCAGCGRVVDEHRPHMKFAAGFGRRIGRFHQGCLPPGGLEAWLEREDARLMGLGLPERTEDT